MKNELKVFDKIGVMLSIYPVVVFILLHFRKSGETIEFLAKFNADKTYFGLIASAILLIIMERFFYSKENILKEIAKEKEKNTETDDNKINFKIKTLKIKG